MGGGRPVREVGRSTAVWLVLLALFAMHGLPMHASAPAAVAMTTTLTTAPPDHPSLDAPMTGCDAADHCTATLRPAAGTKSAPGAPLPTRVPSLQAATARTASAVAVAERPPDISVLQVCRT